jgi:myo-inositol-1-phosphate synthase
MDFMNMLERERLVSKKISKTQSVTSQIEDKINSESVHKLEVWDSPNSAGVIIDAVRCAKIAMDRGMSGPLLAPSSYFMKSPSVQYHDSVAHDNVEAFIAGNDNTIEDLATVLTG